MPTSFHDWRRKFGVVTLVIACVAMAASVRSHHVEDEVKLKWNRIRVRVLSKCGRFALGLLHSETAVAVPNGWYTRKLTQDDFEAFPRAEWYDWLGYLNEGGDPDEFSLRNILENPGFGFSTINREMRDKKFTVWTIPWWSIAIPLTLLSAYLLLSKPRMPRPTHDSLS